MVLSLPRVFLTEGKLASFAVLNCSAVWHSNVEITNAPCSFPIVILAFVQLPVFRLFVPVSWVPLDVQGSCFFLFFSSASVSPLRHQITFLSFFSWFKVTTLVRSLLSLPPPSLPRSLGTCLASFSSSVVRPVASDKPLLLKGPQRKSVFEAVYCYGSSSPYRRVTQNTRPSPERHIHNFTSVVFPPGE